MRMKKHKGAETESSAKGQGGRDGEGQVSIFFGIVFFSKMDYVHGRKDSNRNNRSESWDTILYLSNTAKWELLFFAMSRLGSWNDWELGYCLLKFEKTPIHL